MKEDDENLDDQLQQGLIQIIRQEWRPYILDEQVDEDGCLDMSDNNEGWEAEDDE